jgi:Ankyrin repeats (3 copies)
MLLDRFEWACRHLLPLREYLRRSIRPHVDTASEDLNVAYENVLLTISPQNEECAHRMFECLVVAARHLRFREFAEVITMDFETDGLFKFEMSWREDDLEGAIHIIATKLVGITDFNNDRYAQFAHLAVKEFLTSDRILHSEKERVPQFHVRVGPAHITFAQVCLCILLELKDVDRKKIRDYPLASYAAEYWAHHSKAGGWSVPINDGTKRLFDPQEPYFATWIWLYDIDSPSRGSMVTESPEMPAATPLYYAARYGLEHVVERLVDADPESANVTGGTLGSPLQAAAAAGSVESVRSLLQRGAEIDGVGGTYGTALQAAVANGALDVVLFLLESGADVDTQGGYYGTALKAAEAGDSSVMIEVLRRNGAEAAE